MASRPAVTTAMADAAFRSAASASTPASSFQTGDLVVYPSHGIGQVESVGAQEIAGHRLEVISIHFPDNRMTLRIPLANTNASGLRPVASAATCAEVFKILGGRPRVIRTLWAKRAQDCQAKINSGDIRTLAGVVRDLQAGPGDTGRSYSQRNLFELAMDRLAAEVAAVMKLDKTEAINQLSAVLCGAGQAPADAGTEPDADAELGAEAAV